MDGQLESDEKPVGVFHLQLGGRCELLIARVVLVGPELFHARERCLEAMKCVHGAAERRDAVQEGQRRGIASLDEGGEDVEQGPRLEVALNVAEHAQRLQLEARRAHPAPVRERVAQREDGAEERGEVRPVDDSFDGGGDIAHGLPERLFEEHHAVPRHHRAEALRVDRGREGRGGARGRVDEEEVQVGGREALAVALEPAQALRLLERREEKVGLVDETLEQRHEHGRRRRRGGDEVGERRLPQLVRSVDELASVAIDLGEAERGAHAADAREHRDEIVAREDAQRPKGRRGQLLLGCESSGAFAFFNAGVGWPVGGAHAFRKKSLLQAQDSFLELDRRVVEHSLHHVRHDSGLLLHGPVRKR
mmetsp:Transcript_7298/g.17155  ORF Transcript_7298/g.17155 Transcript_7298/m.17155 type:complete len:364 (-) Transcript_7298:516-1607(-)